MEQRLSLVTLGVSDLDRSRRFYQQVGYHVAGQVPDYYKAGDDCIFYCKVL